MKTTTKNARRRANLLLESVFDSGDDRLPVPCETTDRLMDMIESQFRNNQAMQAKVIRQALIWFTCPDDRPTGAKRRQSLLEAQNDEPFQAAIKEICTVIHQATAQPSETAAIVNRSVMKPTKEIKHDKDVEMKESNRGRLRNLAGLDEYNVDHSTPCRECKRTPSLYIMKQTRSVDEGMSSHYCCAYVDCNAGWGVL